MITERPLTTEELDEIREAAAGLEVEDLDALDAIVEEARDGGADDELVFHLGAWWGERVRALTGWAWVHLRLGEGLEAPALVSDDRGVACLPLQLVGGVLDGAQEPLLREILERLAAGRRPTGAPGSYALVA